MGRAGEVDEDRETWRRIDALEGTSDATSAGSRDCAAGGESSGTRGSRVCAGGPSQEAVRLRVSGDGESAPSVHCRWTLTWELARRRVHRRMESERLDARSGCVRGDGESCEQDERMDAANGFRCALTAEGTGR